MVLYLGGNNAVGVSSADTLNINQIKVLLFGSNITQSLSDADTFLVNTAGGVLTIQKSTLFSLILGSELESGSVIFRIKTNEDTIGQPSSGENAATGLHLLIEHLDDAIGTDTTSGTVKFRIKANEDAIGSDTTSGTVRYRIKQNEDAIGTDSTAGTVRYRIKQAEDAIGSDSTAGSLKFRITANENAIGTDTTASTLKYRITQNETAIGTDATAGSIKYRITQNETAIGTDTTAGSVKYRITQNETAIGTDATAGSMKYRIWQNENSIGTDTTSGTVKYRIKQLEDFNSAHFITESTEFVAFGETDKDLVFRHKKTEDTGATDAQGNPIYAVVSRDVVNIDENGLFILSTDGTSYENVRSLVSPYTYLLTHFAEEAGGNLKILSNSGNDITFVIDGTFDGTSAQKVVMKIDTNGVHVAKLPTGTEFVNVASTLGSHGSRIAALEVLGAASFTVSSGTAAVSLFGSAFSGISSALGSGVGSFIGDVVDSIFGGGSDSTQYDTLTDEDNDGIPDLYEQDLDSSDVLRGIVYYLNDLGENYKFNKIREAHPTLSSTDRIRYKAGIRTDPPYVSDAGYEVFMKGDVGIVSGDLRLVGDLHFGQTYTDTGLARTFSGGSTLSTVLNGKENALTFSSDFTRTGNSIALASTYENPLTFSSDFTRTGDSIALASSFESPLTFSSDFTRTGDSIALNVSIPSSSDDLSEGSTNKFISSLTASGGITKSGDDISISLLAPPAFAPASASVYQIGLTTTVSDEIYGNIYYNKPFSVASAGSTGNTVGLLLNSSHLAVNATSGELEVSYPASENPLTFGTGLSRSGDAISLSISYENPLTFSTPFSRSGDTISLSLNSSHLQVNGSGQLEVIGGVGGSSIDMGAIHAQYTMTGGGRVIWNGSSLRWTQRVILLPVELSEIGSNGYIDISCPTSGTITYYSSSGTTTITCDSNGIPISIWQALYYEIIQGQSHGSSQSRFRLVDYRNSTWSPDENWILVACRNGDTGADVSECIKWVAGQVNIPTDLGSIEYSSRLGSLSKIHCSELNVSSSITSGLKITGSSSAVSSTLP